MNTSSKKFLGTGWKFPVEFKKNKNKTGTATMLKGEEDIRNSLEVLFATRSGERVMHSSYGSALESFLFMPVNKSVITYIQAIISNEIIFNEPRIILNEVEVEESADEHGRLDISIVYTVNATNNRYNYVFPFYINEATNLKR
jgi:phage baseplate assembly protein W